MSEPGQLARLSVKQQLVHALGWAQTPLEEAHFYQRCSIIIQMEIHVFRMIFIYFFNCKNIK